MCLTPLWWAAVMALRWAWFGQLVSMSNSIRFMLGGCISAAILALLFLLLYKIVGEWVYLDTVLDLERCIRDEHQYIDPVKDMFQ